MVANVAVLGSLRVHPNRHFGTHRGPRRPCRRATEASTFVSSPCSMGDADNVTASKHPRIPLNMKRISRFGPTWGDSNHADPMGADEVRSRARFVVISSDWSDPRRSRSPDASRELSFDPCHQRYLLAWSEERRRQARLRRAFALNRAFNTQPPDAANDAVTAQLGGGEHAR